MDPLFFDDTEYQQRWTRVNDELTRRAHQCAVVWSKSAGSYERCADVLYLTNFYSSQSGQEPDSPVWNARSFSAVILQPGEPPELHVDDMGVRHDLVATERVYPHFDVIAGVAKALVQKNPSSPVALVGTDFLPYKYVTQLQQACPGIEFTPDDDLIRNVRKLKSQQELEVFREAGEIITRAHNTLLEHLVKGTSQREAAAAAGQIMIRAGMSWRRMIMNHGDKLAFLERDPLTGYSTDAPRTGEMVRAWIDGIYGGYWLDPGRTAVCGGKPTPAQRAVMEATIDVCEQLRTAIRPGVRVMDVALLGDKLIREAGYGEDPAQQAWPYYGHGLGSMWEPPIIEKRCCSDTEVFAANMVLGVECFLGDEHQGIAGFEDNFIVTGAGTELLSNTPKTWW